MGHTLAVTFSAVLVTWLLPSLWLRLTKLTLLDFFLLSVAMFFGTYTLIDFALAETSRSTDPLLVVTVFLPIFVGTMLIWLIARRPTALLRQVSLGTLRRDWKDSSAWPVVAAVVLSIVGWWFTAQYFAQFDVLTGEDFAALTTDMPYWHRSTAMLAATVIFPATLCCWGKLRHARGAAWLFWLALLFVGTVAIMSQGRRAFFALVVVVLWDILTRERIRWKSLFSAALAIPLLIGFSNLYMTYRAVSYHGIPLEQLVAETDLESPTDIAGLVSGASDVGKTIANLQARYSPWHYNYEVAHAHVYGEKNLQWGWIFVSGLPLLIPSAIYSKEGWKDTEATLIEAFDLKVEDKSENIFVTTYADFGLLNAFVAPLFILLFVWLCAKVMSRLKDPFLRMTIMGMAVFYLLNLEASLLEPFGIARSFIIVALLYCALRAMLRGLRYVLKPRHTAVPVNE